MFYAYVLRSQKDGKFYIGYAEDVSQRLKYHNAGKVQSTKHRRPFDLVHQQAFFTRSQARWQERKWKNSWGHQQLRKVLESSPV